MAYYNSYYLGYNVCFISLEVSKKDMLWNILSRHSYSDKFTQMSYVPHDEIRKGALSPEKEAFLFDVVAKDLAENSKGKFIILDETDFKDFSFSEIMTKLYEVDDEVGGLDAVFFDHAGLFKYYQKSGHRDSSEGEAINAYISFIRRLSIRFRFNPETKEYRQLISVVVIQANREGWKRASKRGGQYDLRAISEANEVEKASYRIFSIYTDDFMKEAKEARVCILKHRSGKTTTEPLVVYVDPVCYYIGDEVTGSFTGSDMNSSEFSSLMDTNSDLFV
jgi:replicative DNA helicase